MFTYRCYFLDPDDQVRSAETFDAGADADAIARALAMLKMRPHHHNIELWQGGRRLYPGPALPGRGQMQMMWR
jgi:hypothetical protein